MNREFITPTDEAHWHAMRAADLTSTDVAALFGLSPYKTRFELWHEKRSGEVVRIADNDAMSRGKWYEEPVAHRIAQERDWAIRSFKDYGRIPAERLGSSFDFRILASNPAPFGDFEDIVTSAFDTADDAILEIKTVRWNIVRDRWIIEDGYIEAPAHIELQAQHQMLVSGLRRAYIVAAIDFDTVHVLEREADDLVHAGIIAAARDFWSSISEGREPSPVMPDDAEAVIRMNQHAEPGKLIDARGDAVIAALVARYAELGQQAKVIADERDVVKAELLQAIGDAEKVLLEGYSVSAGVVGPAEVSYTRPGYRNLRVTAKKAKAVAA